ncbi:MAG: AAA family ATPase [Acidimicrobiales bacterium]
MPPDRSDTLAETHISWVLLSGDHAYKIHKPIQTDFLDRRTVADRRQACVDEVELNARLSPDVYLGVGAITLDGEELEPVVVMRRMPTERRLTALLDTDEARQLVRDVARRVASFHESVAATDPIRAADVAGAAALRRRWDDDLAGIRAACPDPAVRDQLDAIERSAHAYLAGRSRLFDERIERGMVRDVHGDLLAEDIFCLDDGPRILDCLAFDVRLRTVDVLADVAFLVMDLQRLGHIELATAFLRDYCEFSDEHHPGSLAHFHVAQRALVRAKVAAIRHRQEPDADIASDAMADTFLDQCLDHLRRSETRVVLVGGIPGSGKSTLAESLSSEYGWMVLSTDEIRRDLALRRADVGTDAYQPAVVVRVYERLLEEAGDLLALGSSVILDASWTTHDRREAARVLGDRHHAMVIELRCDAPRELCQERIRHRARAGATSEATEETVDLLADATDPWPQSITIDTSGRADVPAWVAHGTAHWLPSTTPPRRR